MGGYGAIYNALKYRNKFAKVVGLSPAVDPEHLFHNFPMIGFRPENFDATFGGKEEYENSDRNLYRAFVEAKDDPNLPELFIMAAVFIISVLPTFICTLHIAKKDIIKN